MGIRECTISLRIEAGVVTDSGFYCFSMTLNVWAVIVVFTFKK